MGSLLDPVTPGRVSCLWALVFCLTSLAVSPVSQGQPLDYPGAVPCFTNDIPEGYGTFGLIQLSRYLQFVQGSPTREGAPAPLAIVSLSSPEGYRVTDTIVERENFQMTLGVGAPGINVASQTFTSEAAMQSTFSSGRWAVSFQVARRGEDPYLGFFRFTLSSNPPPVPTLLNVEAAQTIDATTNFTLQWNAWTNASPADHVHLVITDFRGFPVLTAGTDCGSEFPLSPDAGVFEIPARRLSGGVTYQAYLTFAASTLASTDEASLQLLRGYHSRSTRVTIRTTGRPEENGAATLGVSMDMIRRQLLMSVTGPSGAVYQLYSSTNFVRWDPDTFLIIPPRTNRVTVSLPLTPGRPHRFYRALNVFLPPSQGNREPTLSLTRLDNGYRLSLKGGDPVRAYRIQSHGPDWAGWTNTTLRITTNDQGDGGLSLSVISILGGRSEKFFRVLAE